MGLTLCLSDELRQRLDDQEETIWERLASGTSENRLILELGISRTTFQRWKKLGGSDRADRLLLAREAAANYHAGKSLEVLEAASINPDLTPAQAAIARNLADKHTWFAERMDKGWAEQRQDINLNLNIGDLHLSALQNPALSTNPDRIKEAEFTLLPKAG